MVEAPNGSRLSGVPGRRVVLDGRLDLPADDLDAGPPRGVVVGPRGRAVGNGAGRLSRIAQVGSRDQLAATSSDQ